MNEEDSEQIGLFLERAGYVPARQVEDASVVVLNTCSVRAKPEQKAFSLLGRLRSIKEERPDMVIGVAGCMAQVKAREIRMRAPYVDFVIGTGDISVIPGMVQEVRQTRRFQVRTELPDRRGKIVTDLPQREVGRAPKLKAFIPIQYGCDKFCTFCIVPTTRGRERSRPTVDILEEARRLADQGTKEITLLGQTVNSYGKNLMEGQVPFERLLRALAAIDGIERIRYTSPYPRDFTPGLIETIRDVPQVMEHVHLPLQSGDDDVLKAMHRVYTVDGYLSIVDQLREAIPGVAITTDIIVGFPGESEEQFAATTSLMERVRFDGAYMFAYSPREGTKAAELEQIPKPLIMERLNRLIALQNAISVEINDALVGQEFEVLVEGRSQKNPGLLSGYTREFKMMHFPGSPSRAGRTTRVVATAGHQWGLSGDLVPGCLVA